MKKRILYTLAIIALVAALSAEAESKAHVEVFDGNFFEKPVKIRCTCYCEHGTTASGQKTRYGIVAGMKGWQGYTAELNAIAEEGEVGEFIGYFEFLDTGAGMDTDGDGKGDTIINGESIDVWVPTLEDAYKWRDTYGDYVYMKIIK